MKNPLSHIERLSVRKQVTWLSVVLFTVVLSGLLSWISTAGQWSWITLQLPQSLVVNAGSLHPVFSSGLWLLLFLVYLWHLYFPHVRAKYDRMMVHVSVASLLLISSSIWMSGGAYTTQWFTVIHHPAFFLGVILFFIPFVYHILKYSIHATGMFDGNSEGQLVFYSIIVSLIMILSLVGSVAAISVGDNLQLYYQRLLDIPMHIQQFLNVIILLIVWHFLVRKSNEVNGVNPSNQNNHWVRVANLMMFVSVALLPGVLFLKQVSQAAQGLMAIIYLTGIIIPVAIHSLFLLKKIKLTGVASIAFIISLGWFWFDSANAIQAAIFQWQSFTMGKVAIPSIGLGMLGMIWYSIMAFVNPRADRTRTLQPAIYSIWMMILIYSLFAF